MERFTALISLIAYLIGGWLAPLLHTHSDGTDCHHQHSVAGQHQQDAENQCCIHDHVAHGAEVHRDVPETDGLLDHSTRSFRSSALASEPTDHDELLIASDAPTCGVCVLCLARSSAKERHQSGLFALTLDQVTQSVQTIDAMHRSNFRSCPLSRGPPSVV